jgi:hypothetical protein
VGDENEADHQGLRRALFSKRAPHERALILTIRKPIASPARAFSGSCCIAVAKKATAILRGVGVVGRDSGWKEPQEVNITMQKALKLLVSVPIRCDR